MVKNSDGKYVANLPWRPVYAGWFFKDVLSDARRLNKSQWEEIREKNPFYAWFWRVVKISLY